MYICTSVHKYNIQEKGITILSHRIKRKFLFKKRGCEVDSSATGAPWVTFYTTE